MFLGRESIYALVAAVDRTVRLLYRDVGYPGFYAWHVVSLLVRRILPIRGKDQLRYGEICGFMFASFRG